MTDTNDDDDPVTVDLEHPEEVDWMREERPRTEGMEPAEAVRKMTLHAIKPFVQGVHVHDADQSDVDKAYRKFTDNVNMTADELRSWADHDCSDEASTKLEKVRQEVLHLLTTPKDDWGDKEVDNANRASSFITRMKSVEQGDPAAEGCPSDRDVTLMNWGYRPDSVTVEFQDV